MQAKNEYVEFWNDTLVPYWHRFRHLLSGNGEIHSELAWPIFNIKSGENILDIGCGYGETSLQMGKMTGPKGSVLGIDCTTAFIDVAEQERVWSGQENVHYIIDDAQSFEFRENQFDVAFSRFGIMFFENIVAALRNLYKALKPGGRLCLIVWGSLDENPCWKLAKDVALDFLPPPPADAASCGPGPFSMADEQVTRGKLKAAGFSDVEVYQRQLAPICMGLNAEEALAYQTQVGPAGEIVYMAYELGQKKLPEINQTLLDAMQPYRQPEGYYLPSCSYAIMARKPMRE